MILYNESKRILVGKANKVSTTMEMLLLVLELKLDSKTQFEWWIAQKTNFIEKKNNDLSQHNWKSLKRI
jgi:hypothetical protein